ncbi:MAG TPA: TetR/AcrR family transcriptional regulator [Solirubrobacterales bacterium]|nr:TetR/AcrR family transcriptional regulator [Solirubrobacterales bacterium]
MSPRPQIDHVRRPQILAAAAEVIAERGLAKTRIADVAERAETSSPAVLYWFGTKNKLLTAALHEDERRFDDRVAERLENLESPSEKLRELFEICAEDANWTLWLELWTRSLHDEPMREAERQVEGRWRALLTEVIEEGRGTGEFTTDSAEDAALALGALIDGLAVQVTIEDPAVSRDRMLAVCVSSAETLLDADLSRRPALKAAS